MRDSRIAALLGLVMLAVAVVPAARAASFNIAGPPALNIDTDPATSVFLNAVDPGMITDLNLSVYIGTEYADDVSISLARGATVVQVYAGVGDTSTSVINATFDDEALSDYPWNGSAIGTFRPSPGALSAFDGMPLAGAWELRLLDDVEPFDGTPLLSWSISGETDREVIPEPSTLLLASLGIGLLAALRLRRSRATPAD